MVNRSKAKGTAFETDIVNYCLAWGLPDARRVALAGSTDKGDICPCAGVVIEAKNTQSIDLAGALDQAELEAENAGAALGIAVIKRRNRGVNAAYAVVSLDAMVRILRHLPYEGLMEGML
jgi:hypothetical protein